MTNRAWTLRVIQRQRLTTVNPDTYEWRLVAIASPLPNAGVTLASIMSPETDPVVIIPRLLAKCVDSQETIA